MKIALANFKASIGKTTTAINLAAALVERGHSVRLWDLDGQRDLLKLGTVAGLDVAAPVAATLRASMNAAPADFHLIECPPRREFESQILTALGVCDAVIVPNECEYMMLRGLGNFGETLRTATERNAALKWRALVTKYKPRQKKHLADFLASDVPRFETLIRDSAWVADAPAHDQRFLKYAQLCAAGRAFGLLAM